MRIAVLAGGVGAARFLRGLLEAAPGAHITVIGNTADDITLFGLRVCPDLDTVMYTLGGGVHEQQGWGRQDESFCVGAELAAYGAGPAWFALGDKDLATHIARTEMLARGRSLSQVTSDLACRWRLPERGVRLLPMTDERVETHVVVADGAARRLVHFQEYWVRMHAVPDALGIRVVGIEDSRPAPGVLAALAEADVVLLPPSNPVVSIGTILAVPGVRDAVVATSAPVIGLSPLIGGAPVRGMADRVLAAVGVAAEADAVAIHYGADILDGWLIDVIDKAVIPAIEQAGITCRAVPLLMSDIDATADMARASLALAEEVRR